MQNSKIKKEFILENMKFNKKIKSYSKIIALEEEDKLNFIENFDKIKYRMRDKDIKNINNWDSYKKKNSIIINKKIKNKKKPININYKWSNLILGNLSKFKFFNEKFDLNKKIYSLYDLYNSFIKINPKKLNKLKNSLYFNSSKILYIEIDLRRLKSVVTARNFKKQFLTLSNGLVFKKLNLNHKKYKKSMKITFLVIKNVLKKLNFLKNFNLTYIYIKGLSYISNKIIEYTNKNIKENNEEVKLVYINNHKISNNKFFKFKKIKAIKRRLKKRNLKLN